MEFVSRTSCFQVSTAEIIGAVGYLHWKQKFNEICIRSKFQIQYIVQIHPTRFCANSILPGSWRFISASHTFRKLPQEQTRCQQKKHDKLLVRATITKRARGVTEHTHVLRLEAAVSTSQIVCVFAIMVRQQRAGGRNANEREYNKHATHFLCTNPCAYIAVHGLILHFTHLIMHRTVRSAALFWTYSSVIVYV